MKTKWWKTGLTVFLTLAILASFALGNVALNPGAPISYPGSFQLYGPITCGWKFKPLEDVTVTQLGLYLPANWNGGDGFVESHQIAIWTAEGQAVEGLTATVGPGGGSSAGYVYQDVSPTVLNGGTEYVIGAYWATSADAHINAYASGYGPDPAIEILDPGQSKWASGFQFPSDAGDWYVYYSSPNFQFESAPPVITVQIDIKPGSDPNPINQGANGVIPVAILTTADFDAVDVDPGTVILNGAEVAVRGKSDKLLARMEDVDGDGDADLLCQIDTESWGELFENGPVTLIGETYDGQAIEGQDDVVIVPPQ